MRIRKIKLKGFKRIALTGYTDIEIDFTKKLQLILGMNGSGKSSLLQELSPLPTQVSDLNNEGSKEIWITHRNINYYLSNVKGGKCSFVNESTGEEMNPGGTQAVQKELIKQVFNYDSRIHNLLTGKDNFTQMAPTKRKEWLTELSDVDYDYALRFFNELKIKHRDTQGALKLAKKKLVEMVENLKDDSALEAINNQIKDIELQLEKLNSMRESSSETITEGMVKDTVSNIKRLGSALLRVRRTYRDLDSERCKLELTAKRARLAELDTRSQTVLNEMAKTNEIIEKYSDLLKLDVSGIEASITKGKEEIASIRSQLFTDLSFDNCSVALGNLQNIEDDLDTILNSLPNAEFTRISKEEYQSLLTILQNKEYQLREFQNQLSVIQKEIEHLEKHQNDPQIECPNCKVHFNPSYDALRLETLKGKGVSTTKAINCLQSEIEPLKQRVDTHADYFSKMDSLMLIVKSSQALLPMWDKFKENKLITTYPKQALDYVYKVKRDLSLLLTIEDYTVRIKKLEEDLSKANSVNEIELTKAKDRFEKLESDYNSLVGDKDKLYTEIESWEKRLKVAMHYNGVYLNLEASVKRLEFLKDGMIKQMFQEHLLASIRSLQEQLGILVKESNELQLQSSQLKALKDEISHLEEVETTLANLVNVLSPNTGLIAQGLTGFINYLLQGMNALINSVWSYSMTISPVSVEEGSSSLSYQFPFTLVDENRSVPDIGLGSKGQQEIINLAFRIIACRHLRLTDIPIFADEFGTGFDETHRKRAAEVIKSIVNEDAYSQLFMISHYEDAHGSMTNAEVCVLSSDNITVPSVHNTHVKLI